VTNAATTAAATPCLQTSRRPGTEPALEAVDLVVMVVMVVVMSFSVSSSGRPVRTR
jgi:hypothetical protein